jgi:hypothetical protein
MVLPFPNATDPILAISVNSEPARPPATNAAATAAATVTSGTNAQPTRRRDKESWASSSGDFASLRVLGNHTAPTASARAIAHRTFRPHRAITSAATPSSNRSAPRECSLAKSSVMLATTATTTALSPMTNSGHNFGTETEIDPRQDNHEEPRRSDETHDRDDRSTIAAGPVPDVRNQIDHERARIHLHQPEPFVDLVPADPALPHRHRPEALQDRHPERRRPDHRERDSKLTETRRRNADGVVRLTSTAQPDLPRCSKSGPW